ncbi:MAG: VanZ family protein [Candidatus Cloacimonadales bacterium]|nr:VanZ family protein [Candidatus Cloacimonadales bacterium]
MKDILFSERNQLITYILIIFSAPFVMCRYYLQNLIGNVSESHFGILGHSIKIVPLVFFVFLLFVIIISLKRINLFRLFSFTFILLVIYLGQSISDFYLGHSLHDIQNNWHYIAYTLFSYLMYRYLKSKKVVPAKIILYTFFAAMIISTSDEAFQLNMTNRVFDLGDIGKDILGAVIGLILIFFIIENGKIIRNGWHFRQKKISDYLKNPLSLLFLELVFTIIFLSISSVLTEKAVRFNAVLISMAVFLLFFFIFHLSVYKSVRAFLLGLVVIQLVSFAVFARKDIVYNAKNLVIYKGIPIPYFDVMFFENGTFRLVDKKSFFQYVDLNTIQKYANSILLLGSGETGKGGNGLAKKEKMQFTVNKETKDIMQIIILKNSEAVTLYNNLKRHNKKVTFILHHE